MEIDVLTSLVSILIVLSVASERLVEIIKGFIPALNQQPSEDPKVEARRKAKVSILALGSGIFTALLASPILAGIFKDLFKDSICNPFGDLGTILPCGFRLNANGFFIILAFGLLASGGSALWNSILEYLLKLKELTKQKAERTATSNRIAQETERRVKIEAESAAKQARAAETGEIKN